MSSTWTWISTSDQQWPVNLEIFWDIEISWNLEVSWVCFSLVSFCPPFSSAPMALCHQMELGWAIDSLLHCLPLADGIFALIERCTVWRMWKAYQSWIKPAQSFVKVTPQTQVSCSIFFSIGSWAQHLLCMCFHRPSPLACEVLDGKLNLAPYEMTRTWGWLPWAMPCNAMCETKFYSCSFWGTSNSCSQCWDCFSVPSARA